MSAHIIIKYDQIHLFATGNNDEFLLLIAQDTEASDQEDEDGDDVSIEYRIFSDKVQELYEALQANQALHPDEVTETQDFPTGEMFTADSLQNGHHEPNSMGDDGKFADDV